MAELDKVTPPEDKPITMKDINLVKKVIMEKVNALPNIVSLEPNRETMFWCRGGSTPTPCARPRSKCPGLSRAGSIATRSNLVTSRSSGVRT